MKNVTDMDFRKTVETSVDPRLRMVSWSLTQGYIIKAFASPSNTYIYRMSPFMNRRNHRQKYTNGVFM